MSNAPLQHPADLHYLMEHQVWARLAGDGTATVGITELGIRLSGEIYMCRAKRIGTEVAQGGTLAVVELAKAIVAVKSPVTGTVIEANAALADRPQLVHRDPYGTGWIARLRLANFQADQPALLHGDAVAPAMARHALAHGQQLAGTTRDPSHPAP
ncbi:MAG: glycine cleavage system protein H [Rubrivivax sp.]|nr:glycine cleavage system protein H [Rubrivivax sp.]MCZ2088235.1 glycine cleavage system protein H [Burkholderiales bacterium]